MARKYRLFSKRMSKQGRSNAKGEDTPSPEGTLEQLLFPRTYVPSTTGNIFSPVHRHPGSAPLSNDSVTNQETPPAPPTTPADMSSIAMETAERPKIYYPKEKKDGDKPPLSAPLMQTENSYPELPAKRIGRLSTARKVSSNPELRGDEMFGGNQGTVHTTLSPTSSDKSAETPEKEYYQSPPKLDGIILGSPELSLTNKGTCGTRGTARLVSPERRVTSVRGSIKLDEAEEYSCWTSSTATFGRTPSENNTELSLPGQMSIINPHLPPRPPTPTEFRQSSQPQRLNSFNHSFFRGRSGSRIRKGRSCYRTSPFIHITRGQRALSAPQQPGIYSQQDNYVSKPGVNEILNVAEQSGPEAIDSNTTDTTKFLTMSEEPPHKEIFAQLKALTNDVANIKMEELRILHQLEVVNTNVKILSEGLELEKRARFKSLATHDKSIKNHITLVVGELGEAVESVAAAVASISDMAGNIDQAYPNTSDDNITPNWSDVMEQEVGKTSVRTPATVCGTPFDPVDNEALTVRSAEEISNSRANDGSIGSPVARARSQTNPTFSRGISEDQGQQQRGGFCGSQTGQKRGVWNPKRNNGGANRRGSSNNSNNKKGKSLHAFSIPSKRLLIIDPTAPVARPSGQHPPAPAATQAPALVSPTFTPGGFQAQSFVHPNSRVTGPLCALSQTPGNPVGFPPRQSSLGYNNSSVRGRPGNSNPIHIPFGNFNHGYAPVPPPSVPVVPHVGYPQFNNSQSFGNVPHAGQWPAANRVFTPYRAWPSAANWYQQVYPNGNNNNINSPR
ncbi:uncharacterized protein PADG_01008 [Paracoccidioides brasiliensis Pb18]|uniref:Uncharacterized protein n=1 Tax=Paracoccidioides brasiliensis (strain Pb18) TaxID=502780 RepID=C1FYY2_PARBD|nr:uncharacterized protein PADG_01008 [Paracoccidioides brasiliensis Pb18]EEH44719.1 hypothetical protein PADG_01008 [Paracoccidioides brasiliensis Pb18]